MIEKVLYTEIWVEIPKIWVFKTNFDDLYWKGKFDPPFHPRMYCSSQKVGEWRVLRKCWNLKWYQGYLGVIGTWVEISQNLWPCVELFFSQKWAFFRNFRDISFKTTPEIIFYCILINKFPKKLQKGYWFGSFQKFDTSGAVSNFCLPCGCAVLILCFWHTNNLAFVSFVTT